jgi:acetyltransferase-like isoleucine patch superfamily enzyme
VVLKGVEIGDNCIIGAGCVIHKSIPANSTVLNNQEQILKTN